VYHVDDIPWNPPVEFDKSPTDESGGHEWIRYIEDPETKEHIILKCGGEVRHDPREPRPSPKAVAVMRLLKGIAKALGGDETTYDLSRLMRVPGTMNRKREREGQTPVPCMLEELEPDRVYSLDEFAGFADEEIRETQIEKVTLPQIKKATPERTDKLRELLNVCELAPKGTRSERDFHFCCQAVKGRWDKEAAWEICAPVGRFAQSGRPYFDRTWANAEYAVRDELLAKAERQTERLAKAAAVKEARSAQLGAPHSNDDDFEDQADVANAARLIERRGDRLRWCQAQRSWLVWDGRRWHRDATLKAQECVFELRHHLMWQVRFATESATQSRSNE
jgi:hypothetical protein